MDSGVLDLLDQIEALKAENNRLRRCISMTIDAAAGCHRGTTGEVAQAEWEGMRKAIKRLKRESERFAPSMFLKLPR